MALDCNTLYFLGKELNERLVGGRIDKVYQMSKTQLLLTVHSKGINCRLYLSCDAQKGRVCLTERKYENPDAPPVFCMLLRKHLSGGKITDIKTVKNERIFKMEIQNTDELFETTKRVLIVEIMGKHSNIILTDGDGRILDCMARIDFTVSQKRQVLPGLYYEEPPKSEKIDPFSADTSEMLNALSKYEKLEEGIMASFCGMSPLLAGEIAFLAENDPIKGAVILKKYLEKTENFQKNPVVLIDKKTNEPKNYYIFDIMQYGDFYDKRFFDTVNECVDFFYGEKDVKRKIDEKKANVVSAVNRAISKTSKKLDIHNKNIAKALKKDKYRIYAELITANLYKLTKNAKSALLENYYDNNKPLEVPLDETLSPAKNAKKYFEKYNKEKNMEKISRQMATELERELEYLFTVRDMAEICGDEKSLSEIKEELVFGGYVNEKNSKKTNMKKKKATFSKPLEFVSSDGFLIMCGRNNRQNEELTLKIASKNDLWLHVRNVAGSHTVIRSSGEDIPDKTLEEAAIIAAYYSKKSNDTKVDVDYTAVRYVKKPANAKPGMVIYDNFKGITVEPSKKIVENLKINGNQGE